MKHFLLGILAAHLYSQFRRTFLYDVLVMMTEKIIFRLEPGEPSPYLRRQRYRATGYSPYNQRPRARAGQR